MTYDLSNDTDRKRFTARVKTLWSKGTLVELTEKVQRSLNQNSYLHAILGEFAMQTGNHLEFVKREYYKRLCNRDLFVVEKQDPYVGKVEDIRSSADLTTEEMTLSIHRFRNWSEENGIALPDKADEEWLRQIYMEMNKMKEYL